MSSEDSGFTGTPDAESFDTGLLIRKQLAASTNLCSEQELKEQAAIAKSAFIKADNGDGEVNFDELKKISKALGVKLSQEEEEAMAAKEEENTPDSEKGKVSQIQNDIMVKVINLFHSNRRLIIYREIDYEHASITAWNILSKLYCIS